MEEKMDNNFVEGERYPITASEAERLIRLSGSTLTAVIVGPIDLSRGRRFVKSPGDWELWNKKGHKVKVSISRDGAFISVEKDADAERPEPLGRK
jgi:hypothetical protein